jgi:hypothetical protein
MGGAENTDILWSLMWENSLFENFPSIRNLPMIILLKLDGARFGDAGRGACFSMALIVISPLWQPIPIPKSNNPN